MKKWIGYIQLFWYFASNWNPRLAFFFLRHEIKGERKYRINTSRPIELKDLTIKNGDIRQSSRYEAVNYYILENLINRTRSLTRATTFTDLGCGKGRVMVVAAHYGFKKIRGVDFAEEVCAEARHNMTILQKELDFEYEVSCTNVLDYTVQPDDTVFFMFNPFTSNTISGFLDKVEESLLHHPRDIYFLYVSPRFAETFFEYEYETVYRKRKLKWLDGVILKKEKL